MFRCSCLKAGACAILQQSRVPRGLLGARMNTENLPQKESIQVKTPLASELQQSAESAVCSPNSGPLLTFQRSNRCSKLLS